MTNCDWMETQNLIISFDYSWFLAKNLAYAECLIMKFHYRNSSSIQEQVTIESGLWWRTYGTYCQLSFSSARLMLGKFQLELITTMYCIVFWFIEGKYVECNVMWVLTLMFFVYRNQVKSRWIYLRPLMNFRFIIFLKIKFKSLRADNLCISGLL